MAHFEIRKQLTFDDFNHFGKGTIEANNIDKNKDGIIQGSEFNNLFDKFGKNMVNKMLATEESGMQNTSRVQTPDGQAAIENFNKLSADERKAVLKKYSDGLKIRRDVLYNNYRNVESNYSELSTNLENLINELDERIAHFNDKDKIKELDIVLREDQKTFQDLANSIDGQVTDALIEYGGKDIFGNRGNYTTEIANEVVSFTCILKNDIKATFDKMACYAEAYKNETSDTKKGQLMTEMNVALSDLHARIEKGKKQVLGSLISVVENAYKSDSNASGQCEKFAEEGIPNDLNMDNKVSEGVLMDVLMDAKDASTSGVLTPKTDKKQAPIYDISGQQVTGQLQKGRVYIQDGKKFVAQ